MRTHAGPKPSHLEESVAQRIAISAARNVVWRMQPAPPRLLGFLLHVHGKAAILVGARRGSAELRSCVFLGTLRSKGGAQMAIWRLGCAVLIVVGTGCGGHSASPPDTGDTDGSAGGTTTSGTANDGHAGTAVFGGGSSGGEPPGEGGADDAQPSNACDVAGERRDASPAEGAQYCVCEQASAGLIWRCYGPSPTAPIPSASCASGSASPGTGDGSCLVNWSCADGRLFQVSCVDGACYCLVQGVITTDLAPLDSCPVTEADANTLCGWNLM
jgi:hypothetical protein